MFVFNSGCIYYLDEISSRSNNYKRCGRDAVTHCREVHYITIHTSLPYYTAHNIMRARLLTILLITSYQPGILLYCYYQQDILLYDA